MDKRLRAAGFVALLLVVAALAHSPLASAGFVGDDLPFLVRAAGSRGESAGELAEKLAEGDGPLARLSLRLSFGLWARGGTWSASAPVFLRLENLLLLLGAAACARLALRRALAPWAGRDGARAAAGACAVLVACHPLGVPAVAAAGARGDLLALLFIAGAAASFLRGRQERRAPALVMAGICAFAAGHSSGLALLLPPLLCGLELACARRHRPLAVRSRTALTTFLVFGACVGAEALTGEALGSRAILPGFLRSTSETLAAGAIGGRLREVAAGLGAVALPVPRAIVPAGAWTPGARWGSLGLVIAGIVLLAALQPVLVAARSAPRLWGWLAASTCAGVLLPLLFRSFSESGERPATSLAWLLPAAMVGCAALAVASTALSGARRVLLPASVAASFVLFSRGTSAPWTQASRSLDELRSDLDEARALHGGDAGFLLVDPPEGTAGLQVAGPALGLLLDPSLCPAAEAADSGWVRGIASDALFALAREPEFESMRREKLVLLLRGEEPRLQREIRPLLPPKPSSGTLVWREDLRSGLLDVDPFERRALRAVVLPGASTAEAPRMGWRAGESETHSLTGVWIGGREGLVALFDLSPCADWLFGPRVHRAWLEGEIGPIPRAELLRDVPPLPGRVEPDERAESWVFHPDSADLPRPVHGEPQFVLGLLDVETLRYVEIPAQSGAEGDPTFPIAPGTLASRTPDRAPCAWSLELRAGDACIARTSGRR